MGIALNEGHIRDIDDPISDYITVSPGSAYDGVPIRHVLQMSPGARWKGLLRPRVRHHPPRHGDGPASHTGCLVADMVPENAPGTVCRYNSADTQALGALLVRATKRSLSDYMGKSSSSLLGFTSPGYWVLDGGGMEMAFAGLLLTPRDFAKIGELYRNGGVWNGHPGGAGGLGALLDHRRCPALAT